MVDGHLAVSRHTAAGPAIQRSAGYREGSAMTNAGNPRASFHTAPISPCVLRITRLGAVLLLAALLSACKIVITVPFGGKVVTEDGFECRSGQTCVIDVTDATFDSTFTAVPAAGHSFTRWRRKPAAFCSNGTEPCYLSTTGFAGNTTLMDILASDQEFYLEPVFVHYNVGYWSSVLRQIEQGSFATADFLYAIAPDVPNCDPGALSDGAKARALQALNQVRALHSLPAVALDNFYDMQAQEASLVQRANTYLNHLPAPADACYTRSAADGAASANLFGGNGPEDPADHIFGWTNDNNNLAAVMEAGHRRWNLNPAQEYASYGQVDGYSALKVFDFGSPANAPLPASLAFVALPYKSYPYNLVSQDPAPTPWSLSMVPPPGVSGSFNFFQNATVKVVDQDSGASLAVQNLHRDNKVFGVANFLSWMVAGWEYDRVYRVTVNNIAMPGGGTQTVSYPVMVDRYNLFRVNYPLEGSDRKVNNKLQGRFDTAADRDSYTIRLASNKTLTGQSEFSNQGFFILVYDADKRLLASADSAINRTYEPGKYTIIVSPCDENGICYQGTQTYSVTIN